MIKHGLNFAVPFLLLLPALAFAQPLAVQTCSHSHGKEGAPIAFLQNQNQWEENVRFRASFEGRHILFLEDKNFTYLLSHPDNARLLHDNHHGTSAPPLKMHAYKVHFVNAGSQAPSGENLLGKRHNFFLGNDPGKWAGKVASFGKIVYKNLYDGIDLHAYSNGGHFKYDFVVAPHAPTSAIQLKYEGVDGLALAGGNLVIATSVENIIEQEPLAWQMVNGQKIVVKCQYKLQGNQVGFDFPNGFDPSLELVIDPTVIAATVAGTANLTDLGTFGHSATFDNNENIYTAGRSFGAGYPATTGAFDLDYNGGNVDIAISKYNPEGTDLVYATYLGGNTEDQPHSLVADFNQRLYIYGSSNSSNYPVTGNAYQNSIGGSTDIVVTVLSEDGSSLVGSSYFGGNYIDGINVSTLNANYGDDFRGEIILDGQNNVYVVSNSASENFPTTPGAFDNSLNNVSGGFGNPAQDVVVFKASSDLSALYWSTYLGGDHSDTGNGIRLTDVGEVIITGTAGHSNFPTTAGTLQSTWPGGNENAFVAKIAANGNALLRSTFWGSTSDEHAYFIDIDEDDNVHIFGQSTGNMPVTQGTYTTGNGGKAFLAAFDEKLENLVYSTVFGDSDPTGVFDLVPVAFMVDKCNQIYFSGYYAVSGLPTTTGAFNTQGDNFYLGVLEPNATALSFGTYFGDAGHVDGGTSRFDKGGIVYQGVCSCQWSGILETNPDAWETVQVSGCDVGVFKIDFEIETVTAAASAFPGASGCAPYNVNFLYTGQDATSFYWDFGDGSAPTTVQNPSHLFEEAGSYIVTLAVVNANSCNATDTFQLQIDVLNGESTLSEFSICDNEQFIMNASTLNATYTWQDGSTAATFVTTSPGVFWVDVQLAGCSRRDSFIIVPPAGLAFDLGDDSTLCDIASLTLDAAGSNASTYLWSNGSTLPQLTTSQDGLYWVAVTDSVGCTRRDSILLNFSQTPLLELGNDTTLCHDQGLILDATTLGASYLWQNGSTASTLTPTASGDFWVEIIVDGCPAADSISVVFLPEIFLNESIANILCNGDCNGSITVAASGGVGGPYNYAWANGNGQTSLSDLCPDNYPLTVTDGSGCSLSQVLLVSEPPPLAFDLAKEDNICYGEIIGSIAITNDAGGTPPYTFALNNGPFLSQTLYDSLPGGNYTVWMEDANGCGDSAQIYLIEPQPFEVFAGDDDTVNLGQELSLNGMVLPNIGASVTWTPSDYLNCNDCLNPNLLPLQTTLYTLTATDPLSGCTRSDDVLITVQVVRNVYIPNAWSPNSDGINDEFMIFTGPEVARILELKIFDRWGELVFESYNFPPNNSIYGWNGSFRGKDLKPAVFAYFARVEFIDGFEGFYEGDVTLVR
jgi:gliding motility-associated-like protein